MNEDLSEYNHPESIISLLSPVSWLQMDEIKINSDFNLSNQNGYVKNKSERIIKELTYGKSKICGILLKIIWRSSLSNSFLELCQAKASNLHSKLSVSYNHDFYLVLRKKS